MRYLTYVFIVTGILFANDEPRPHPHLLIVKSRLQEADNRLDELQRQLDWFTDHIRYYTEEEAEQYEVAQTRQLALKKLRAQFQKTHNAFILFRNELRECHVSMLGTSEMDELVLYSKATLDATNWYVDYIHTAFFPEKWKDLYKHSKYNKPHKLISQNH